MTRVFIAAASPLARSSLESLLSSRGFSVVAGSGDFDLISEQLLDVVRTYLK